MTNDKAPPRNTLPWRLALHELFVERGRKEPSKNTVDPADLEDLFNLINRENAHNG